MKKKETFWNKSFNQKKGDGEQFMRLWMQLKEKKNSMNS